MIRHSIHPVEEYANKFAFTQYTLNEVMVGILDYIPPDVPISIHELDFHTKYPLDLIHKAVRAWVDLHILHTDFIVRPSAPGF